jgi:hypothetical protein
MTVTLGWPRPSHIACMYASLIAGTPFGCVCIDYAAREGHVNCGITSEPMSSMVCSTLSWGTL